MASQDLDVPAVTYEWLRSQPGGLHYAVVRILQERSTEPACVPGISCKRFDEPLPPNLSAGQVVSIYLMAAHLSDLIHELAGRLGWDEVKQLVGEHCRVLEESSILASWKRLLGAVHELFQHHAAHPKLPPEELLRLVRRRP